MRTTYRTARTSTAATAAFFVLALRVNRRMDTFLKPAARNSSRKASPSLAPAIQANQSISLVRISEGRG